MPFEYTEKEILFLFIDFRKQLKEIELKTSEYIPAFKDKKHKEIINEIREDIDRAMTKYKTLENLLTSRPNLIEYFLQDDDIIF